MALPYAADAETSLSPSELDVLRNQYEKELASGHATTQTKFNYAWGLVKSKRRDEMAAGVDLLTEIYRSDPPRRRECLYYLALGHFKMGNFEEARRFNGQYLLQLHLLSSNRKADSILLLFISDPHRSGAEQPPSTESITADRKGSHTRFVMDLSLHLKWN